MALVQQGCYCRFDRLSALYTFLQGKFRYANFTGQLRNRQDSIPIKNTPVSSGVIVLFLSCSPIAVFRAISLSIISSFKAVFWGWSRSHVGQKGNDGCPPLRPDSDPSAAIVFIGWIVWVFAAAKHCLPDSILWWVRPILRDPMYCLTARQFIVLEAATTPRCALAQVAGKHELYISTIALTFPSGLASIVSRNVTQYCIASKSLASQIIGRAIVRQVFLIQASATTTVTAKQITCEDAPDGSAVTPTFPFRAFCFGWRDMLHGNVPSKPLTNNNRGIFTHTSPVMSWVGESDGSLPRKAEIRVAFPSRHYNYR